MPWSFSLVCGFLGWAFGGSRGRLCVLPLIVCLLPASTSLASEPDPEPEAGAETEPDSEAEEDEETDEDAEPPSLCETQVRLEAVVYMHHQPERSLVMVDTPQSTHNAMYSLGMYVDGHRIVAVEPRGVLLQKEDTFCWLRLVPDPSRPDPPPKRRSKKSRRKK